MKFIHLSDLHFHDEKGLNKEENKKVRKALEYIKENYRDHKLIITGDVVDDGDKDQYKRAFDALEPFKGRLYMCPGNHDYGIMGNAYSPACENSFDEYLSTPLQGSDKKFAGEKKPVVFELEENIVLIALNTNLRTNSKPLLDLKLETRYKLDFARGEVGNTQLAQLGTILSNPSYTNKLKILFLHHHPFTHFAPLTELEDSHKLLDKISGKVHVVLFGHKHKSGMYKNPNGFEIPWALASDDSPGKGVAREITIKNKNITIIEVPIN